MKFRTACARFAVACAFSMVTAAAAEALTDNLWERGNLVACVVNHFDAKNRNPEETAQMFNRLGITKLAYNWREPDVAHFDELQLVEMVRLERLVAHGQPNDPPAVRSERHPVDVADGQQRSDAL